MQTQAQEAAPSSELFDGVLIQQARMGNERAFETVVHRYSGGLLTFIYHLLGDYDQAGDVLQQVFLQLYTSLFTLDTEKPLKPWLMRVAHNRCVDELRRKWMIPISSFERTQQEEEPLYAFAASSPFPEEVAEQHELQQLLSRAIQALSPKVRSIVLLRYTTSMTFAEIGQTLGIPEATAKTSFQRAKPLLRASLRTWIESI